jgi:hypothetical protein
MRLFFWKPKFVVNQGIWVVSKKHPVDERGRPMSWPGSIAEVLPDRLHVFDILMNGIMQPREFTHDGDGLSTSSSLYLAPDRGPPRRHDKNFFKATDLPKFP